MYITNSILVICHLWWKILRFFPLILVRAKFCTSENVSLISTTTTKHSEIIRIGTNVGDEAWVGAVPWVFCTLTFGLGCPHPCLVSHICYLNNRGFGQPGPTFWFQYWTLYDCNPGSTSRKPVWVGGMNLLSYLYTFMFAELTSLRDNSNASDPYSKSSELIVFRKSMFSNRYSDFDMTPSVTFREIHLLLKCRCS